MCNCGKKRSEYSQPKTSVSNKPATSSNAPHTNFEYTGNSALTIKGSITKKSYRFNYPGHVQPVDHRDAASMTGVPVLKKIN